jgi:hypothetical protein
VVVEVVEVVVELVVGTVDVGVLELVDVAGADVAEIEGAVVVAEAFAG